MELKAWVKLKLDLKMLPLRKKYFIDIALNWLRIAVRGGRKGVRKAKNRAKIFKNCITAQGWRQEFPDTGAMVPDGGGWTN